MLSKIFLSKTLNMVSVLAVSGVVLTAAFVTSSRAMENEEQGSKTHGMLLRAELPNGKNLHFVPSEHSTLLGIFSENFKKAIFSHQTYVLESVADCNEGTHPTNLEDFFAAKIYETSVPLYNLLRHSNKEYLEINKGFLRFSDPQWSFKDNLNLAKKYEQTFQTAMTNFSHCGFDLSHFNNIFQIKPGVVFSLYSKWTEVFNYNPEAPRGMDDEIADYYEANTQKKPLTVETRADLIQALRIFEVTYEDIRDDFEEAEGDGSSLPYTSSLLKLHEEESQKYSKKRLFSELSDGTRNEKWMPKLMTYADQYNDPLCVFGQAHFVGKRGLITLGQEQGWKWSIFEKNGEYKPFHYDPTSESPIVYSDSK